MDKQEAINLVKKLTKTAGAERLRALFNKYRLTGTPLRASGVITGMRLHGAPFFNDLVALAKDGAASKAYAVPPEEGEAATTTTGTGKSAWDYILEGLNTGASSFSTVWGALNGSQQATVATTGANGQVVYVPVSGSSGSSGNTALWVILAVVGVAVVGLVIFLAVRKK